MKKIAFCLVLVLVSSPAWAEVVITCTPGPGDCNVTVSFDASSEANYVRGFGLDIDTGDANVTGVKCVNEDYYVYPGEISIDSSGTVTDWGECVCSGYSGTQSDNDDPNITIEMVSNYDDGHEPNKSGDLVIITVSKNCDVNVAENVILGGVVMENPAEPVDVNPTGCSVTGCSGPVLMCWDNVNECGGQSLGDSDCDGSVNFNDLLALKLAFFTSKGDLLYNCCSDADQDEAVNFNDLLIVKLNFFTSNHTPATGSQGCPP